MNEDAINARCIEIADIVVPEYRNSGIRAYSCTGHYAKRWNAAWMAARIAMDEQAAA